MQNIYWIYTTWPDRPSAKHAAETLIAENLCACANILAPMTSLYRWQGEVRRDEEVPLVLKTASTAARALKDRVAALHPYDEPCFLALPVDRAASAESFMAWVIDETRPR